MQEPEYRKKKCEHTFLYFKLFNDAVSISNHLVLNDMVNE